jgi:peptidyl-prolyl cis-trans isomerase SurA
MKSVLSNKIKRSSRASIISDSFYQMLLDKYEINYDNKNMEYFESIINDEYFNNSWSIPDDLDEDKILITIRNQTYSFLDFATYIDDNQGKTKTKENIISSLYIDFINNSILEMYKSNLENENKDYKYILKEYKEGLLLFDLMQEKIWNVASKDSIKMKEFYELNKSNYTSFDEDKGEIIGDYQDFLENNWIKKLRKDNLIVINKRILKRIKKLLENNE